MKITDVKTVEDFIRYQGRVIEDQGKQIQELYKQIGDLLTRLKKAQDDIPSS